LPHKDPAPIFLFALPKRKTAAGAVKKKRALGRRFGTQAKGGVFLTTLNLCGGNSGPLPAALSCEVEKLRPRIVNCVEKLGRSSNLTGFSFRAPRFAQRCRVRGLG